MNIFERASRKNLTLVSNRGNISFNDLWKMPLTARDGFSLDEVAKQANRDLKTYAEESFVETTNSEAKALAELRLEIVKHVIAARLAEKEAAATRAERADKRARLLEALAEKEGAELASMSKEDILKELNALDA